MALLDFNFDLLFILNIIKLFDPILPYKITKRINIMSADNNKKSAKISIKGETDSFLYKFMRYLGIILLLVAILLSIYFLAPELCRLIMDYVISVIKKDYPTLK